MCVCVCVGFLCKVLNVPDIFVFVCVQQAGVRAGFKLFRRRINHSADNVLATNFSLGRGASFRAKLPRRGWRIFSIFSSVPHYFAQFYFVWPIASQLEILKLITCSSG